MGQDAQQYEIKAGIERIESFDVIGISIVTNNETGADDINGLWERFFKESVGSKVQDKVDDNIYAVYSDYEGDHTKPYRLTIGHKVKNGSLTQNKEFYTVRIETSDYAALSATGPQPQSLIETWTAVWESDMDRSFRTDYEFYGPKFFEEGVNEVILYIGLNETQNKTA